MVKTIKQQVMMGKSRIFMYICILKLLNKCLMKTMRVFLLILPVLFSSFTRLPAQDHKKIHNFRLGVELGATGYWGDVVKPEQVRENHLMYDNFRHFSFSIDPSQSAEAYYVGVKPEYFFFKNRVGVTAGLRVSKFSSTFESDNSNPVMWLLRQEGLQTDYVRLRSITQNNYYVGIPLEIRFFPNRRELPFQHYLKLGVALNYQVYTEYKMRFYEERMHVHAATVAAQLGKPEVFNAYIYPTFGFKIGRSSSPWVNVELYGSVLVNRGAISFLKDGAGVGLQVSVQLPMGKSAPVGSE
jgi:hypothetical protein